MSYLSLALHAEGPSDYRFLSPILRRLAEHLCLAHGNRVIDVGAVVAVHVPEGFRAAGLAERILESARAADNTFHIMFVHTDGGGDPNRARGERVEPAVELIALGLQDGARRVVAVVPVRESEAWALADGEAVRAAFGTGLEDARLGIPERAQDVEAIGDPKEALQRSLDRVVGGGRRRGRRAVAFLEAIGERVSIHRLREVPAFRRLWNDLQRTLEENGFFGH